MITLELSIEQINAILQCLAKMPYDYASPIIQSIQVQATPQVQPKEEPKEETK